MPRIHAVLYAQIDVAGVLSPSRHRLGVGVGLTESLPGQQRQAWTTAFATRLTFRGKQLGVRSLIVPQTFRFSRARNR